MFFTSTCSHVGLFPPVCHLRTAHRRTTRSPFDISVVLTSTGYRCVHPRTEDDLQDFYDVRSVS